ncbi:MAG: hypothetical protein M3295_01800 [Chloroflexota bacterium]|nr:hypothetical protein [Chloroflexota bacterium]
MTLGARLGLGLLVFVAIVVALVLTAAPHLLDGYVEEQERTNLQTRAVFISRPADVPRT